jgi:probable rRNA maturation factor
VRPRGNVVSVAALDGEPPRWVGSFGRFCLKLLDAAGVGNAELSVALTGDRRMRELNRRYREVDRTTDVLSFRQEGPELRGRKVPLGDIVISVPAVERNARRYGVSVEEELRRVTAHGILHLRGSDHRGASERARMTAEQEMLLAKTEREKVFR